MSRAPFSAALLLILPLALIPAGCGEGGASRAALRSDEQMRDLDLALQGDTGTATFQDTALSTAPAEEPTAEPAPPRPAPAPAPPPRRPAPRRTQPRAYDPPPRRPAPPVAREPAYQAPAPAPEAADYSGPGRSAASAAGMVPSGSTVAVLLNQTLSTDGNVAGDEFSATLQQALVGENGEELIPAGAIVHGRVTAVSKSSHVGEAAVIKLAFESVTVGGRSYPLEASVEEAHPQRVTRNTVGRTAGRAAAGAAAGAILSRILGKSAVGGAVLGAAAGTAVALGTAEVDAVLPQGSTVVIRTDAPITVARR